MTIEFEVPNLDCVDDPYELDLIRLTLDKLSAYAKSKAQAIQSRKSGMIETAVSCEKRCEVIYRGLPEWARW